MAMADMFAGTLPGGALALSQNGAPVYHYGFLSTFAERCVVPEVCCVPIREDVPLEVAALVGCAVTGLGAAVLRAQVEPEASPWSTGPEGSGSPPSSAASWRARASSPPTRWPSSARRLWPSVRRTPSTRAPRTSPRSRGS